MHSDNKNRPLVPFDDEVLIEALDKYCLGTPETEGVGSDSSAAGSA